MPQPPKGSKGGSVPANIRAAGNPAPMIMPSTVPPTSTPASSIQDELNKTKATFISLIQTLETKLGHPVIAYVLKDGAQIADDVYTSFCDIARNLPQIDKISLLVHTNGGQTETPYKIMTLLRNYAKEVDVLVAVKALSAGTHLAMGADHILMSRMAQLGPVDPNRQHPLLPLVNGQRIAISVQDLRHCMEFLKKEANDNLSSDAFAQVISAMFQHVHPLAIGAIEESYALGKLVSQKMLEMHMDPQADGPKILSIVEQMSDGYKSHNFAFGVIEAERIGLKASLADAETERLMTQVLIALNGTQIEGTPQNAPKNRVAYMGVVASSMAGQAFHMHTLDPSGERLSAEWIYVA